MPFPLTLGGNGKVALWKFSVSDSLTETRPLLSFSADVGPIRTLAWAPVQSDPDSANIIVTAGYKGFKFWDIRDPFRPLWDYTLQGVTLGLSWLPDPRCLFGSFDDGTMWLLSLARAALDIPITGKASIIPKPGFHIFLCSSFAIWSLQASQLTGMVAYCGEDGTTFCFKPTTRSVRDPSRQHVDHYLCGSLLEEGSAIIVSTPSAYSSHLKRNPNLKRSGSVMNLEKEFKHRAEQDKKALALCDGRESTKDREPHQLAVREKQAPMTKQSCDSELAVEKFEVFPPKSVALHKVRWNMNKGCEKWLCYGGAAGLLRCHEVNFSHLK